jgi:hypothetical protein
MKTQGLLVVSLSRRYLILRMPGSPSYSIKALAFKVLAEQEFPAFSVKHIRIQ